MKIFEELYFRVSLFLVVQVEDSGRGGVSAEILIGQSEQEEKILKASWPNCSCDIKHKGKIKIFENTKGKVQLRPGGSTATHPGARKQGNNWCG